MTAPGRVRSKAQPAAAVRSITILGATGSVGTSTVDLIKRDLQRYRVEAVTAQKLPAKSAPDMPWSPTRRLTAI